MESYKIKGLMKKMIAVTLGITMTFGAFMLPGSIVRSSFVTASAYTIDINDCKFTYEFEGEDSEETEETKPKVLVITGIESHGEKVEIPSTITHEGTQYPVEKIGNNFLNKDAVVRTVIFPDTVKSIGDNVLYSTQVENIVLPDELETLGFDFASSCDNIKSVEYSGTKLRDVGFFHFRNSNISCLKNEKGATCLGNWLIKYEDELASATLKPADLGSNGIKIENIALRAFKNNTNLTELDLEGIKHIDNEVFSGCSSLKKVYNANDLTYLGEYAFENCTSLETISDANNIEELKDDAFIGSAWYDRGKDNGLVTISNILLYYRTDSNTIDITKGDLADLKRVCTGAFTDCTNADTFKCLSGCTIDTNCFYVNYDQTGKDESMYDPIPKIPTYKIKNIYLDGKKLEFTKEEPLMDKWVAENYHLLVGTEWLKINAEAKVKAIFEQMDLPFYGINNDKVGTLSKEEEFYAVLKIHNYISTYSYDDDGGLALSVLLSKYDNNKRGLTCASYAEMHAFLLECTGVKSIYLSDLKDHAWNEFCIGDEWFETDDGWNAQSGHGFGWFALSTENLLKKESTFHVCRYASSWHRNSNSQTYSKAERTLGDINKDCERDETDVDLLWDYVKGESKTIDSKAGDINFDGKIDVTDALLLDSMVYAKAINPYTVPDDGMAPGFKVYYLNGEDYKNITYAFTDRDGYITLPEQSFKGPEGKVMRYDIGKVGERVRIHNPCTVIRTQWVDPSELDMQLGDVNGDKSIDIEDAVAIIQHINGMTPLTDSQEKYADVSKDGNIDIDDAVTLISYINGNSTF